MQLTIYRVVLYYQAEDPFITSTPLVKWIEEEELLITFSWEEAHDLAEKKANPGPDSYGRNQKVEVEKTSVLTTGWS